MTSSPAAHPLPKPASAGAPHEPYVPATQAPAELTPRAIVLGVLLGLIFGASNVYLALKIGLTVSASIPIAVLSITIFRWLGRSTILENNIVQTTGSAADSVSAGVVFTIPAILLMGYDLDISRVTILAIAGGLMGVLMMIPLRRALIVKEHGNLPYVVLMPAIKLFGSAMTEPMFGTTKLIRDMSAGEVRAAFVFYIGAGAVASAGIIALARSLPTIVGAFRAGFADMRSSRLGQAVAARLRTDDDLPISLTVFGSVVLAIILAFLPQIGVNLLGAVLIILFGFFFTTVSSRICGQIGSSANPISGMTIAALIAISFIFLLLGWTQIDDRVRAISIACVIAVAVANGGNTSQDLKTGFLVGSTPRRQQIAILIGAIGSALAVGWTLTFLNNAYRYQVPETRPGFVAPASGRSPDGNVVVHSETMSHFGIGGTDSIDNNSYQVIRVYVATQGVPPGKYLVDPASHEIRYVVDPGIGGRIHEYRGHELKRLDSPKATLMALITDGILTHKLPWALVLIGVFLTIAIELMGVSSLPVAVGVYLPLSTSAGMFAGGIVRWLVERKVRSANRSLAEIESGPGVLFASGLIAGGAICGIAVAAIAGWGSARGMSAEWLAEKIGLYHTLGGFATSAIVGLIMFTILGVLLYRTGLRRQ